MGVWVSSEVKKRVQTLFASKRGSELVEAISEEIGELHSLCATLSDQLRQLRVYQSFTDRVVLLQEIRESQSLPVSARICASHALPPEDGFYQLEYESNGRPFRWTGPSPEFTFRLYVDRTAPLALELQIGFMIDIALQSDITAMLDGVELPLDWTMGKSDGNHICKAVLPAGSGNQVTQLMFMVPHVLQPPGNSDPRLLGVAFRELRIQQFKTTHSGDAINNAVLGASSLPLRSKISASDDARAGGMGNGSTPGDPKHKRRFRREVPATVPSQSAPAADEVVTLVSSPVSTVQSTTPARDRESSEDESDNRGRNDSLES
jgi:hypothetical protein